MGNVFYLSTDMETTGLDGPVKTKTDYQLGTQVNGILQFAFRLLDSDFNTLATYNAFIDCPEKYTAMDSRTRQFHEKNGYIDLYEAAEKQPIDVVEEEALSVITAALKDVGSSLVTESGLLDYLYENDDKIIIHGKSVHFDRGFMNAQMPRLALKCSHQIADVSQIRTFFYGIDGMPNKIIAGEPDHEALSDVDLAISESLVLKDFLALSKVGQCKSLEEMVEKIVDRKTEVKVALEDINAALAGRPKQSMVDGLARALCKSNLNNEHSSHDPKYYGVPLTEADE